LGLKPRLKAVETCQPWSGISMKTVYIFT